MKISRSALRSALDEYNKACASKKQRLKAYLDLMDEDDYVWEFDDENNVINHDKFWETRVLTGLGMNDWDGLRLLHRALPSMGPNDAHISLLNKILGAKNCSAMPPGVTDDWLENNESKWDLFVVFNDGPKPSYPDWVDCLQEQGPDCAKGYGLLDHPEWKIKAIVFAYIPSDDGNPLFRETNTVPGKTVVLSGICRGDSIGWTFPKNTSAKKPSRRGSAKISSRKSSAKKSSRKSSAKKSSRTGSAKKSSRKPSSAKKSSRRGSAKKSSRRGSAKKSSRKPSSAKKSSRRGSSRAKTTKAKSCDSRGYHTTGTRAGKPSARCMYDMKLAVEGDRITVDGKVKEMRINKNGSPFWASVAAL